MSNKSEEKTVEKYQAPKPKWYMRAIFPWCIIIFLAWTATVATTVWFMRSDNLSPFRSLTSQIEDVQKTVDQLKAVK